MSHDHENEAERCLREAAGKEPAEAACYIAEAQVHATLGLYNLLDDCADAIRQAINAVVTEIATFPVEPS